MVEKLKYLRAPLEHGGIKEAVRLEKGTGSGKFLLTAEDGQQLLLKVYPGTRSQAEELNRAMVAARIRVPRILETGVTEDGLSTYELREWIPGISLAELLATLSESEQYEKGLAAGAFLKDIHAADCFGDRSLAPLPLSARIDRAIARYDELKASGASTYQAEVFKEYLLSEPRDTTQEPACLLHGDFHVGNIIVADDGSLWAIDWVYGSSGEPIEDFARIFVSADICPSFARGQIDGYFEGELPQEFWQKLKRYAALHQLEALSLSLGTMPSGQSVQEHQQTLLLKQYNGMKGTIPGFYSMEGGRHES